MLLLCLDKGEILYDNFPLSCGVNSSASGGRIKEREDDREVERECPDWTVGWTDRGD